MKPSFGVIDTVQNRDGMSIREKVVLLCGVTIYKPVECYPIKKDKHIGFTCGENNLTYVEDD